MGKSIKPEDLGAAIEQELTMYHSSVVDAIDRLSKEAASELVEKTKATAPVGARGNFRRNISSKVLCKTSTGSTHVWYVKSPDYRLTHLLVHGHATKDGGRTKPNLFLENAVADVLPKYKEKVEEAIKNGK